MGAAMGRRELLARSAGLGLAALIAEAAPLARLLDREAAAAAPATRAVLDADLAGANLQAFADTIIPGRRVARTESGAPIHPGAIAGVDRLPGAVETDALALYRHPGIGFDTLAPAFLTDLEGRSTRRGGTFLALDFAQRTAVCMEGLSFANHSRALWEAAAAVPFTAFCAAGVNEDQVAAEAAGYRVMGLPGRNLRGYRSFSYRRRLARERTRTGSLP